MKSVAIHWRTLTLISVVAFVSMGCRSPKTVGEIEGFADKVCKCETAECAKQVQDEYLAWWKGNQRSRGSEGDRKDVEKAMGAFATCFDKLVPQAQPTTTPEVPIPEVDLGLDPVAPADVPEAGAKPESSSEIKTAAPTQTN